MIFALKKLRRDDLIPQIPVYVASPLTVNFTAIFKLHPQSYATYTRGHMRPNYSPSDLRIGTQACAPAASPVPANSAA